jgi:hypothetical protein
VENGLTVGSELHRRKIKPDVFVLHVGVMKVWRIGSESALTQILFGRSFNRYWAPWINPKVDEESQ